MSEPAGPELRDPLGYRLKRLLLGPPLEVAELHEQRLGKPTALAVFASDNLSSAAYATEEILRVLVPAVGVAAFALVVPVTLGMLVVLAFLILSYRQTIRAYPTAGGAYMVTRDNFGLLTAQVAGVALLTDYVLTVAVSVAAGTDAVTSALSVLSPWRVLIAAGFVMVIAYGNLRGVKESGRMFSVPTYFFIAAMALMLGTGLVRALGGGLHPMDINGLKGAVPVGKPGATTGLLHGAALFVVLHAFASGGAAVTGVEAISNGVSAFRAPQWRNARTTLVVMGALLATMFLGLSALSTKVHAVPFEGGTPTVIAQVGKAVFGRGAIGHALFYALQTGTALILIMAANTSFADFPRLANFHAADNFMPRQLMAKGHRLVFSNGILALAGAALIALIATAASVDRLIPLYAIGVFTSFTLSQAGMARRHLRRREGGWRRGLLINGFGAVLSLLVEVVILVTKFTHGAWVILILVPLAVAGLVRLHHQYEAEDAELSATLPAAVSGDRPPHHIAIVPIEGVDAAAAAALRYGRMLAADELRAVHFVVDPSQAQELAERWEELGLGEIDLELVECPDRRVGGAAAELCAELADEDNRQVSVLIPQPVYRFPWRLAHNRSANAIARATSALDKVTVTFVPYVLGRDRRGDKGSARGARRHRAIERAEGVASIGSVRTHERVRVRGSVHSAEWKHDDDDDNDNDDDEGGGGGDGGRPASTLVVTLEDDTGRLLAVWPGGPRPGQDELLPGAVLELAGVVDRFDGQRALLSPDLRVVRGAAPEEGDEAEE